MIDEFAPFIGTLLLLCYVGYVLGYQCGREAGIKIANDRHEEDRKHRARVIAELDAAKEVGGDG